MNASKSMKDIIVIVLVAGREWKEKNVVKRQGKENKRIRR